MGGVAGSGARGWAALSHPLILQGGTREKLGQLVGKYGFPRKCALCVGQHGFDIVLDA